MAEASSRINLIAFDILDHFENYCQPKKLKAMVVCSSRATAVEMYNLLSSMPGDIVNPRVVITFGDKREGDDDDSRPEALKKIADYHEKRVKPLFGDNDEKYTETVCDDFKNPEGDINMLIVKDMLLTGFDAPVAGVLYVDKSLKEHNLLQAIARVNRIYKGKDFGLVVDYWGIFSNLRSAIDLYDDAESEMNQYDVNDIDSAILGPIDEKNKLKTAYTKLVTMFDGLSDSSSSDDWQMRLADEIKRSEFYEKLKTFANLLNLALCNRAIFVEVGTDKIESYKKSYLFFNKLRRSVIERFDNTIDASKYEYGIRKLINTFVNATEIQIKVEPVFIGDEKALERLLKSNDSSNVKADKIKTRIESELKQIRYDDPLLFEEFSTKIKKTLAEYDLSRDGDKYLQNMLNLADDFKNGRLTRDYPTSIASDSDAKAFYGAVVTILREKRSFDISIEIEELIANLSQKIKLVIADNAKRDWKHNEVVHKQMHRALDDCLFDMFEQIGVTIDNTNINVLDLIIDEIMKVAVARY